MARRDLAKHGWLRICTPTEYGRSEAAVMMPTTSESDAEMASASYVHMNTFGLESVVNFGTDEQKRLWLMSLFEGKEWVCFE